MTRRNHEFSTRNAVLRVGLIYFLAAGAWIYFSDRLLESWFTEAGGLTYWQTYKGLVFVTVTALLLSAWLQNHLRKRDRLETELKTNRDELTTQLKWVKALRTIDLAIADDLRMDRVLSLVLAQVREELEVDCALILLMDEKTETLNCAASRGFLAEADAPKSIRLGQGIAGRAAQQRRTITTELDRREHAVFDRDPVLDREGVVTYCAVPLIAQNQILGVLEVFQRSVLETGDRWLSFLEALAGQAAIAIKASELFDELRETERFLSTLIDNLPGMVYRCKNDRQWTMQFVSQQAEELTGFRADELIGNRKLSYADLIHSDDRQEVWDDVQAALTEMRPFHLCYRIVSRSGKEKWVDEEGQGVFLGGDLVAIEGIITDITSRKLVEEEFQHAQKMEALGFLAAGIAHDFRNLLTGIAGYSALALEEIPQESAAAESLRELKEMLGQGSELTTQLMAISRQEKSEKLNIDLREVIRSRFAVVQRTIGSHIEAICHDGAELDKVHADPAQIGQVLMNLAINARDAMPDGGRLDVRLDNVRVTPFTAARSGVLKPGCYVRFSVADTGCGIDRATKERIFEPFFTTKEERGTGLGLSSVYRIVQDHKGHIQVDSEPGKGTTFNIFFPAKS